MENRLKEQSRKNVKTEKSKHRQDMCHLTRQCGGCQYQGMPYKEQLEKKRRIVKTSVESYCKVLPVLGMEHPYHYRNKVTATFARLRSGKIISGVYKEGTHQVIDIDSCQIEDGVADKIIVEIKGLLKSFKIKIYDEDTGYGLLRHVMVRRGFKSGQVMVVLVLASPILPSKNNFVKAIRKNHPEISTVVINVNDKKTSMVLGDRNIVLYGKGYIEDELCGLNFRISPSSFYQVNSIQTEVLYNKAMEFAALTGEETVIDAYCGIGTIGMIAAVQAKEVIGAELNASAVRDAIMNAKNNNIKNIRFVNEDAGSFMEKMADQGGKADVVFMDPPRSGSDERFLSCLTKLAPDRIVYVSCCPETLGRDLKYLTKHGYEAKLCQPVDMFPFVGHVETCVLLSHKSPDSGTNVRVEFGEGEGKVPLDTISEQAKKYQPKPKVTYKRCRRM